MDQWCFFSRRSGTSGQIRWLTRGASIRDARSGLASAVAGTPTFSLSEIPIQAIADGVGDGTYKAKPAKVFRFDQIHAAHRLMETDGQAASLPSRFSC